MTASQDKVQSIIQTLLEESLPLVHKGVFTSQELQEAMYALQRKRRNRIQQFAPTNPLFKKQGKTDFCIIKRIIRLWDRTMHKFKYNIDLWKQYIDFCIKTNSKKQFYKALSNALRFIPFSQDLWMIGVYYQIQVGLNMWKARKLFIKALRMNPKKLNLWVNMFKFEIQFLQTIFEREKAIQGEQGMKFITGQNSQSQQLDIQQQKLIKQNQMQDQKIKQINGINLQDHDVILLMVYQQALQKLQQQNKGQFIYQIKEILSQKIKNQRQQQIKNVLRRALKKIQQKNNSKGLAPIKKQQQVLFKINLSKSTIQQKCQYYKTYIRQNKQLNNVQLDKIFCQFILKKQLLAILLNQFIQVNSQKALSYISSTQKIKVNMLPIQTLGQILKVQNVDQKLSKKVLSCITPNIYLQYPQLMKTVIQFNKKKRNFKANTDIHRSISILARNKPQVIQRCLHWIHSRE